MHELVDPVLVALLVQYLVFSFASTAALARSRRLGLKPSASLTARLELRGSSFELLVLTFIGSSLARRFWGYSAEGELIVSSLIATIAIGTTIAWLWPLARIRRFGHSLSIAPIFALSAIGVMGAIL
jgi:hypothetical protein